MHIQNGVSLTRGGDSWRSEYGGSDGVLLTRTSLAKTKKIGGQLGASSHATTLPIRALERHKHDWGQPGDQVTVGHRGARLRFGPCLTSYQYVKKQYEEPLNASVV